MNPEVLKNRTMVCHETALINSNGVWHGKNVLLATVPLLLNQLSLISLTSHAVDIILRPLRQPTIVAQILGGVVLGPSFIGHVPYLAENLFPERGTLILETMATFGLVLFLFAMGIKMDTRLMFRPQKTALSIGLSLFVFTMILPTVVCIVLVGKLDVEPSLRKSLPVIVGTQSLVAFPAIACLLVELRIFNTEIGRLAMAVSMFYDLLAMSTCAVGFALAGSQNGGPKTQLAAVMATLGFPFVIVYIVRPLIFKFLKSNTATTTSSSSSSSGGTSIKENHLFIVFFFLFTSTIVSEVIGQHYFLGPMVFGLALPDGSPLGAAVVSKLDTFVSGLLYPTFLTITGLKTDIFVIPLQESWRLTIVIVIIGVVLKFGAVMIPAVYGNIPLQEAFVLGLVLNARGINELIVLNLVLEDKQITENEFSLLVLSTVIVTAIITPLIRIFYDPSGRFISLRRMTIQHSKKDAELRIMVCLQQQDNVPTILNLLEASSASEESLLSVIVIILVEVVGHSAPMLLAYRPHRSLEASNSRNNHISNAFQQFEKQTEGNALVQVFTNMSHFNAMHEDISRVAIDKRANLVIVPFHKQWAIDGTIGTVNRSVQAMNAKLIEWAPCSLGILVDRGPINGSLTILNSRPVFHVAVLFVGGADDVEALAYGARLAKHKRVIVTIIRFLLLGQDNSRERKHDTATIEEYRLANGGNERLLYREELVKDGVGLAKTIRSMDNKYELILVGRNHQHSPLLFGLHEWSECPELGVIGDLLASPDNGSTASVLIIQQQKMGGKMNTTGCLLKNDRDMFIHDEPSMGRQRSGRHSSVTVSIDREQSM